MPFYKFFLHVFMQRTQQINKPANHFLEIEINCFFVSSNLFSSIFPKKISLFNDIYEAERNDVTIISFGYYSFVSVAA